MLEVKGLVSISIPFLNGERFLSEAIESVFAQTYNNWELFLVDDGSTDRSTAIAQEFTARSPERVHYLEHPGHGNYGLACSRNLGARHGAGEYLAFLDSDDVWLPQALDESVALMNIHSEAGLMCTPSEYWYDWDEDRETKQENKILVLAPGDRLYRPPFLLKSCYPLGGYGAPCPCSFLLRRAAFERVGGFEECFNPNSYQLFEDLAFLAKIYLSVPVFVGSRCLSKYRRHSNSMSIVIENTGLEESARRHFFSWLRKYLLKESVLDLGTWWAVLRQTWPYWVPLPPRTVRFLRTIRHRFKG